MFWLWLRWKLLGRNSVILHDFDEYITLRKIIYVKDKMFCYRHGRPIALEGNGTVKGASYVVKWEYLF